MTIPVYCFVRMQGARVAGFPDEVDTGKAIAETERLRVRLLDAIHTAGRSFHLHGHLFELEVVDAATGNHICHVEATP